MKDFLKNFGRSFVLYQPLHYITYLNQTAPLFEILHHEKIKTQNVTAMVKLNCIILILPDLLKKYIDAPHPNTAEKHKNKLLHTL